MPWRAPCTRAVVTRDPADLDAVTSADATTVAWLMHADAVVRLAGGRFVTVIGKGGAGDVLRLTGMRRRLDVVGDAHDPDRARFAARRFG